MSDSAWSQLRERYPWPAKRPQVKGKYADKMHGWLSDGTWQMIRKHLPKSGIVLELGTWMGRSAQRMMETEPEVRLVCVDHWMGSPDINQTQAHREMLPYIFDLCRHHLWPYRDRIVLLRMNMADGMQEVHQAGLRPGMVYVDGAHDARSVEDDACGAGSLFPAADLVGDDWARVSVREGVCKVLGKLPTRRLSCNENAWYLEV